MEVDTLQDVEGDLFLVVNDRDIGILPSHLSVECTETDEPALAISTSGLAVPPENHGNVQAVSCNQADHPASLTFAGFFPMYGVSDDSADNSRTDVHDCFNGFEAISGVGPSSRGASNRHFSAQTVEPRRELAQHVPSNWVIPNFDEILGSDTDDHDSDARSKTSEGNLVSGNGNSDKICGDSIANLEYSIPGHADSSEAPRLRSTPEDVGATRRRSSRGIGTTDTGAGAYMSVHAPSARRMDDNERNSFHDEYAAGVLRSVESQTDSAVCVHEEFAMKALQKRHSLSSAEPVLRWFEVTSDYSTFSAADHDTAVIEVSSMRTHRTVMCKVRRVLMFVHIWRQLFDKIADLSDGLPYAVFENRGTDRVMFDNSYKPQIIAYNRQLVIE